MTVLSRYHSETGREARNNPAHFFEHGPPVVDGNEYGCSEESDKIYCTLAIAGLTIYELSRMIKRKSETVQTDIDKFQTEPREPGDYRSIYNL
jgi:hypothetical protein